MELLHVNVSAVRDEVVAGRRYKVANATLIVPGVLRGSQGALFYPPGEIAKNVDAWNGMPLVAYHPTENGQHVSGRSPKVFGERGLGTLWNVATNQGKLVGEAWFDVDAVRNYDNRLSHSAKILPRLENGQPIELSTGLFTENVPAQGTWNGKPFDAIARNYRPDHLAVLPDQKGACSNEDGCGINVINALSDEESIKRMAPGAIKRLSREERGTISDERISEIAAHQPTWTTVKGVEVLKSPNSPLVAVPATGKRNSKIFSIIDVEKGEEVTQLAKSEVNGWLAKRSMENSASKSEGGSCGQGQTSKQTGCTPKGGGGNVANEDGGQSGPEHVCKCGGTCEECVKKGTIERAAEVKNANPEGCNQYKDCGEGDDEDLPAPKTDAGKAVLAAYDSATKPGFDFKVMEQQVSDALSPLSKDDAIKAAQEAGVFVKGIKSKKGVIEATQRYIAERKSFHSRFDIKANAFCATGEGGGVDPSCGGNDSVTRGEIASAVMKLDAKRNQSSRDWWNSLDPTERRSVLTLVKPPEGAKRQKQFEELKSKLHKYEGSFSHQGPIDEAFRRVRDRLPTGNAGTYGNPQSAETGKFKPHGSGTGKGPVHEAAQKGFMQFIEQDRVLGKLASLEKAALGNNPPSWAVDEDKWERAKTAADKSYGEGDEAYWSAVAAIYRKMGGTTQSESSSTSNQENVMAAQFDRQRAQEWLVANCDCWKTQEATLNDMSDEDVKKHVVNAQRTLKLELTVNSAKKVLEPQGYKLVTANGAMPEFVKEKMGGEPEEEMAEEDDGETVPEEDRMKGVTKNGCKVKNAKTKNIQAGEDCSGDDQDGECRAAFAAMDTRNQRKTMTDNEWLAQAPPRIREVVTNALEVEHAEKHRLVTWLVNNTDHALREQASKHYGAKSLRELRKEVQFRGQVANHAQAVPQRAGWISGGARPTADYTGLGGFETAQRGSTNNSEQDEPLGVLTMNDLFSDKK